MIRNLLRAIERDELTGKQFVVVVTGLIVISVIVFLVLLPTLAAQK